MKMFNLGVYLWSVTDNAYQYVDNNMIHWRWEESNKMQYDSAFYHDTLLCWVVLLIFILWYDLQKLPGYTVLPGGSLWRV